MKPRMIVLTIASAIVIWGGLGKYYSTSGQDTNRRPACGCYVCGTLNSVDFPNKHKDCAGILATDACPVELALMPAETRKAYCQELKSKSKNKSFDECLILRHACQTGEDPLPEKCEPPRSPWLDPMTNCKDIQNWEVTQSGGTVTLSMCGYNVFSNPNVGTDRLFSASYIGALKNKVKQAVGDKVCCDRFRESMRSGTPCDPRRDVDCDGQPNSTDDDRRNQDRDDSTFPNINIYGTPNQANIDPFPPGLSLPELYPTAGSCERCQWVLMKGELKCNVATPDGKRHVYQAKWKCPSSGIEVDTFKYESVTARCP